MTPTLTDADRIVVAALSGDDAAVYLAGLAAGMERAAKDAERYRYLRDHCFDSFHNNQYPGYNFQCTVMLKPDSGTPTLDAAIDAAIRKQAKGGA